jgi:hypothetical protein
MLSEYVMRVLQEEREREIDASLRARRLLTGRRLFFRWALLRRHRYPRTQEAGQTVLEEIRQAVSNRGRVVRSNDERAAGGGRRDQERWNDEIRELLPDPTE